MENTLETQAEIYAKSSTNTRCAKMGNCNNCGIRFCDYRSRVEAFKAGYIKTLK